jgi:hypothetical protein
MLRTLCCALLVTSLLTVCVEAQRGGGFQGGGFRGFGAGMRGYSGHIGRRGFSHGYGRRNSGYNAWGGAFLFPDFLPDDESYSYVEPPANQPAPQAAYYRPEQERPPADPQMIELPTTTEPAQSTLPPTTTFILTNGERLEARRFVLTASDLSVTVNRAERRIPLDSLDLDATLAANRARGINLQIPADHNEISLSF